MKWNRGSNPSTSAGDILPVSIMLSPTLHDLTLIIPAYNEEQRLPKTLPTVRQFLDGWAVGYRVVVTDDGSRDRTACLAASFGPRFETISLPQNRGKGYAVRTAMLSAQGRVVAFTDADLPYHLDALRHGYELIEQNHCDVVFGARDLPGSFNWRTANCRGGSLPACSAKWSSGGLARRDGHTMRSQAVQSSGSDRDLLSHPRGRFRLRRRSGVSDPEAKPAFPARAGHPGQRKLVDAVSDATCLADAVRHSSHASADAGQQSISATTIRGNSAAVSERRLAG